RRGRRPRPGLLSAIYKDVSPVLISRFGDREETVRREVWATYVVLLNQTALYGGQPQSKDDSSLKRKRNPETMEVEEGPYSFLKAQVPAMSKALLNQLKSPKTPPATLQDGFALLHALLDVLPGSLASQVPAITATSKSILSQPPSTTTSTLHLACLSFLALFFASHSPPTFASSLPNLTPAPLRSLNERHPRVASETFRVFSALNAGQTHQSRQRVARSGLRAVRRTPHRTTPTRRNAPARLATRGSMDALNGRWLMHAPENLQGQGHNGCLILGELGRTSVRSNNLKSDVPQQEIFRDAIKHFAAEQEEIRAATSFAAGNIAVGSLQQFLLAIVKTVKSDAKKRLLSLHALKEVVTHSSQGQLEDVADILWVPLFENSEETTLEM
ncbi:hypothetical protein C8R45DRAFT_1172577, partial [Mycena sanguinolenta]